MGILPPRAAFAPSGADHAGQPRRSGVRNGGGRALVVVLLAWCALLAGQELSVSMSLEVQMVLFRGFGLLAEAQEADGSWCGDCATTAHCLLAMATTGLQGDYEALKPGYEAGLAFLRGHASTCPVEAAPAVGCLFIRAGGTDGAKVTPFTPGALTGGARLTAMELLCLSGAYKSEAGNRALAELKADCKAKPYMAAAEALSGGDVPKLSLRRECATTEELYWAARALAVHPETFDGHWRNAAVSLLLDWQRPDGTWGAGDEKARLQATAYALRTIVLCL